MGPPGDASKGVVEVLPGSSLAAAGILLVMVCHSLCVPGQLHVVPRCLQLLLPLLFPTFHLTVHVPSFCSSTRYNTRAMALYYSTSVCGVQSSHRAVITRYGMYTCRSLLCFAATALKCSCLLDENQKKKTNKKRRLSSHRYCGGFSSEFFNKSYLTEVQLH